MEIQDLNIELVGFGSRNSDGIKILFYDPQLQFVTLLRSNVYGKGNLFPNCCLLGSGS